MVVEVEKYFNLDCSKPIKIINHNRKIQTIAKKHGWLPGARYTNLRDIRNFNSIGFIDIDWKNYNFKRHLTVIKKIKPYMTVARDIENIDQIDQIINEAKILSKYCKKIIIVPKYDGLSEYIKDILEKSDKFILGYSVPTGYGKTDLSINDFIGPVHLLGGRPTNQKRLSEKLNIVSLDCNSITIDAKYGKYFNGNGFTKVKNGNYEYCIEMSIIGINNLWDN